MNEIRNGVGIVVDQDLNYNIINLIRIADRIINIKLALENR